MSDWRTLMKKGRFEEAEESMLAETGIPGAGHWSKDPESQGWFYETWGDAIAPDPDAVEKYQKANVNFSIFASGSTSGGEGTARMAEVTRVREKINKLKDKKS